MTPEQLDRFEEYLETLPPKQRDAVESLQIFVEENFTDEEQEQMGFRTDRDEGDWYIWVCGLNGKRFNLVFDYSTEEVERVDIN